MLDTCFTTPLVLLMSWMRAFLAAVAGFMAFAICFAVDIIESGSGRKEKMKKKFEKNFHGKKARFCGYSSTDFISRNVPGRFERAAAAGVASPVAFITTGAIKDPGLPVCM